MPRWRWLLTRLSKRLWVRTSLIGSIGVLAALLGVAAERYWTWPMPGTIGADAVESLLTIIASSMLAVTTFSLSIMVSAYGSATTNVTPRATKLLIEDELTQTVLATFIGSFLFGIVGIIVLKTGSYGERGRVVLFIVTIAIIALVVVSLLRWIDHLTRLGRVSETTDRVEKATQNALRGRMQSPYLGGRPLVDKERDVPKGATSLVPSKLGYVQHIDMAALSKIAEDLNATIYINAVPGTFLYPHMPIAWIADARDENDADETLHRVRDAFTIGDGRTFEQDPRFGLAVMSEIALRALSPATNDPGTAIDVIGRMMRLLCVWAEGFDEKTMLEPEHPRIHVPPLRSDDLFEDAFMLIGRDGAGLIEVQLRLQKVLTALSQIGDADFQAAARHQSKMALSRAQEALNMDADKERLRAFASGAAA